MNAPSISTWFATLAPSDRGPRATSFPWLNSRRGTALAIAMIAAIAALDLWGGPLLRNTYSILYVIPLVLLAHTGNLRHLWRWAWLMVALNYSIHFLKSFLFPLPDLDLGYFDFRLINRTFVAFVILAVARLTQVWIQWQRDQREGDLPEADRADDEEVASTVAAMCCVPMIAVIAILDFTLPAHINLAILYPIPLFVAAWTGSRTWLWYLAAALLLLTVLAFFVGRGTQVPNLLFGLERQHLLAAFATLAVAADLHFLLGQNAGQQQPQRRPHSLV
jgi:hypothetical protein